MKFYLYFDDDVFTHIFDIEEVRLSNENLYNKIMKKLYCGVSHMKWKVYYAFKLVLPIYRYKYTNHNDRDCFHRMNSSIQPW